MNSLKSLFTETFKLYFANFPAILLIVLPIALPVEWIKNFYYADYYESVWTTMRRDGLVEFLFLSVITPIVIHYFHKKETGEPARLSRSFIVGLRKWPRIILYGFVKNVVVLAGLIFFIVPGIIFYFRLFFMDIVITLEEAKGRDPLGRSRMISQGNLIPIMVSVVVLTVLLLLTEILQSFVVYWLIDTYWLGDTLIDVFADLTGVLHLLLGLKFYMKITGSQAREPDAAPVQSETASACAVETQG